MFHGHHLIAATLRACHIFVKLTAAGVLPPEGHQLVDEGAGLHRRVA
jgi:hypothetical protein